MLQKTRGIVLKTTNYRSSSVIAQIFTEKFGLQAYLINGVRKAGSRIAFNVLQPLHLLDMVVYHKSTASLQRVKDIRNQPVFFSIPLEVVKSTITLFLCEVLYKVLRQQSGEDSPLFQYIFNSMEWLDHHKGSAADFHLLFLMGLTRYLGFYPDTRHTGNGYFDLQNGRYVEKAPPHPWYLNPPQGVLWQRLNTTGYSRLHELELTGEERKQLLNAMLEYYSLHIEGFGTMRSYEVLQELFA